MIQARPDFYGSEATKIFPLELIEDFLTITDHEETVVYMALTRNQRTFAERFYEIYEYEEGVKEMIQKALDEGNKPDAFLNQEINDYVASSDAYADMIANALESGEIENSPQVRSFFANEVTNLAAKWRQYRIKMLGTFEKYHSDPSKIL